MYVLSVTRKERQPKYYMLITYIVGINSLNEIKEINKLNAINKKNLNISFKKFVINNSFILDPRKWPKKI